MTNLKKYSTLILASIMATFLAIMAGAINWPFQLAVCFALFYLSSFILFHRYSKLQSMIVLAPWTLTYVLIITLNFNDVSKFTIPIALAPYLSFLLALCSFRCLRHFKLSSKILIFIFAPAFIYITYLNYFVLDNIKIDDAVDFSEYNYTSIEGNSAKLITGNNLTVVYVWNYYCTSCLELLPELESTSKRFQYNYGDVKFYALHAGNSTQEIKAKSLIKKLNYELDSIFLETDIYEFLEQLNSPDVPIMLYFDSNLNLIKANHPNFSKFVYLTNPNYLVERLLNN
ncbi:hypothetical protein [Arsukibacterium perlucidum]|uniref:hypothetical protein n=1 Tax=Arsukibacterium perlucidum TaxID=368811 RepID=UPI00037B0D73|nr:hypothetical protein [Arsukibacterium perlucidum]